MQTIATGWRAAAWLLGLVFAVVPPPAVADDDQALLQQVRVAVDEGRFSAAEALLRAAIDDPDGPVVDELARALEIIRRVRLDYTLTADELLTRLRRSIPDASAEDLGRWRRRGLLQQRLIDGEVRYFKREPSNLFRVCEQARARRTPVVKRAGWRFDLPAHLARLVAEAEHAGDPRIHAVKHRVRYELCVKDDHPRVRPGAQVRCWLPFPQAYRQQRDVRLLSTEPSGAVVAPNGHAQRTVYFEQTVGDASTPPRFVAEFEFTSCAYVPKLDPALVRPYEVDGELYRRCTAERRPHVVFTPEVRRLAAEIVGDEANPLLRARRIFRWVSGNIAWCAELEYSTIPNLAAKGLDTRRGDCGVQSMVFITLCRAAGIPARWQSGWQTLPNRRNMHDWSEFYVEPWGWLPADASYGLQEHDDPRVREFYCGHIDAYRLIVNLDHARELYPPKRSFRSEPTDFQRGEIEIDGHNLYYDEWDWSFDVRTVPPAGGMAALDEALDAVVPRLLVGGRIPGAVIAIGRRTETGFETWQKAYGFLRSVPEAVPMPANAVFDLASLTKPIATGTSLMMLVEQGRVKLDDPVSKYLPKFDQGDKRTVTIRQLMTHTSGMRPYVGAAQQKVIKEQAGFPCPERTRAYVRALELARPPGDVVAYSCLNAILCAEVVEAVSGQPLDRFAARNIFEPLGMSDTGFNPSPRVRARIAPTTRAERGVGDGGFLAGQVHDPLAAMQAGVSGNAGLFSTASDLARFAQMLLVGGELDGVRVLQQQTVRDMTRIQNPGAKNAKGQPDRRGLLWDLVVPDPGDSGAEALFAFGHNGYTGTAIRIYPEQGVYVIALTNRVHPDDSGQVGELRARLWTAVGQVLMGVAPELRINSPR